MGPPPPRGPAVGTDLLTARLAHERRRQASSLCHLVRPCKNNHRNDVTNCTDGGSRGAFATAYQCERQTCYYAYRTVIFIALLLNLSSLQTCLSAFSAVLCIVTYQKNMACTDQFDLYLRPLAPEGLSPCGTTDTVILASTNINADVIIAVAVCHACFNCCFCLTCFPPLLLLLLLLLFIRR